MKHISQFVSLGFEGFPDLHGTCPRTEGHWLTEVTGWVIAAMAASGQNLMELKWDVRVI